MHARIDEQQCKYVETARNGTGWGWGWVGGRRHLRVRRNPLNDRLHENDRATSTEQLCGRGVTSLKRFSARTTTVRLTTRGITAVGMGRHSR